MKNPPTERGGNNDASKLLVINHLCIIYMIVIECWGQTLGACWKIADSTHSEKNPAGGELGSNKHRDFHRSFFIKRRHVLFNLFISIYTYLDFLSMSNWWI